MVTYLKRILKNLITSTLKENMLLFKLGRLFDWYLRFWFFCSFFKNQKEIKPKMEIVSIKVFNRFQDILCYVILIMLPWIINSQVFGQQNATLTTRKIRKFIYEPEKPNFLYNYTNIDPDSKNRTDINYYMFWLIAIVLITFIIITLCVFYGLACILCGRCLKYRKETLRLINNKHSDSYFTEQPTADA